MKFSSTIVQFKPTKNISSTLTPIPVYPKLSGRSSSVSFLEYVCDLIMDSQFTKYQNHFKYNEEGKETCLKILLTKLEEAVSRAPYQLKEGEKVAAVANRLMKGKKFQRDNFLYFKVNRRTAEKLAKIGSMYLDVEKMTIEPESVVDVSATSDCQSIKVKTLAPGISTVSTTFVPLVEVKKIRPKNVNFSDPVSKTTENLKDEIIEGIAKMEGSNGGFTADYMVGADHLLEKDVSLYGEQMSKVDNPLQALSAGVGLVTPYRYVAVGFCPFPLHIEDYRGINSSNYLACGNPKIWIIIPKNDFDKLCSILEHAIPKYVKNAQKCYFLHKNLWIHPFQLSQWGIDYHLVVQRPGEMIVTGCCTFHQGFNLGWNVATAINLILYDFMLTSKELMNRPHCENIPRSYFEDLGISKQKSSGSRKSRIGRKKEAASQGGPSEELAVSLARNGYNNKNLTIEEAAALYFNDYNDCVHIDFYWEQRSIMFDLTEPYISGKEDGYTDATFLHSLLNSCEPYSQEVLMLFYNANHPNSTTCPSITSSQQVCLSSDNLLAAETKANTRWNTIREERKKMSVASNAYYQKRKDSINAQARNRYQNLPAPIKSVRNAQRSFRERKEKKDLTQEQRDIINAKRRKNREEKLKAMDDDDREALRQKDRLKFKKLRENGRLGKRLKRLQGNLSPANP